MTVDQCTEQPCPIVGQAIEGIRRDIKAMRKLFFWATGILVTVFLAFAGYTYTSNATLSDSVTTHQSDRVLHRSPGEDAKDAEWRQLMLEQIREIQATQKDMQRQLVRRAHE